MNERKLSFENYQQITYIAYENMCSLAHSRSQTRLQDTAYIPVRPEHFSSVWHLIPTKSPEYIAKIHICCLGMLWFDAVGRMRMERMERNGKSQLRPFHAHMTHHVKPKHSSTLYMAILQYTLVILRR